MKNNQQISTTCTNFESNQIHLQYFQTHFQVIGVCAVLMSDIQVTVGGGDKGWEEGSRGHVCRGDEEQGEAPPASD